MIGQTYFLTLLPLHFLKTVISESCVSDESAVTDLESDANATSNSRNKKSPRKKSPAKQSKQTSRKRSLTPNNANPGSKTKRKKKIPDDNGPDQQGSDNDFVTIDNEKVEINRKTSEERSARIKKNVALFFDCLKERKITEKMISSYG